MNKEIWSKYTEKYGIRFLKKDKKKFQEAILDDFRNLGYEGEVITSRKGFGTVSNIHIGNPKQAKTCIVVPYDTPARVFWYKNPYYPQDGYHNFKKSFIPTYVPILLIYGIILVLSYVGPIIMPKIFNTAFMSVILMWLLLLLIVIVLKGIPNFNNAVRNSASLVIAYDIASKLSPAKRKEVMFVFTDCKKRYYGNEFVNAYLDEHKKISMPIISLYCLGDGNDIRILSSRNAKNLARAVSKEFKSEKYKLTTKSVALNEQDNTSIQGFNHGILLSSGNLDKDNHLLVDNTALAKDKRVSETMCDDVVEMIVNYLNKVK